MLDCSECVTERHCDTGGYAKLCTRVAMQNINAVLLDLAGTTATAPCQAVGRLLTKIWCALFFATL